MQRGKKSLIIRLMVAFCLVFAMGAFVVLAGCAGSCGGSTAATYSVTYNYDQTESTVTGSDEATEGESFSFTAQAKTDYKLTSVTATVGGEDVELDQSGNTYTIAGESVTGDIVVTVDAEALPVTTYTVEYADVTGATVEGAESVEEGASLTFTVTAETGYEISSVTATVGGESVTPASNGNEYTIANVTGNVVVTVVASKISYAVTVNAQNADVKVAESISYGEDLTFTVDAKDESYEVTSVTVTVGGENANVTNEGNEYTVSNVTGDVVITVNAAQKTYNVEIDATNATVNGVTDGQKVNHGAEISFTVSATDGYEIVLVDAKMAGKDIEVVMDGDTYSIPNVTGDVIIIVTTKLIEYTVDVNATNATVNGITDGQEIAYGEDLTFTVNANPGYENVKVSATVGGEDVTLSNEGNSYTISDIDGNVVITVTASQIVYDVTVNAENATVTVDESIAYGETLEFTVKAEEGYTVTKVTVNNEEVTAGSDGTYTVENITSDVTIVVATEISTYTVSVAENDHAQVNFVGETTVQHGGQVQFTVAVDNGFTISKVFLNADGANVVTPDGDGVYTISNITSDIVIYVALSRQTYSVSFNEGNFEVSGDPTVAFEGNYTFGVVANEGYNIASVTAVMGGEPVSVTDNEDGSYTIANVTGNIEVTITCQVITFGVEYNYDEEQVIVEGADSVDYNGGLTFTVTAKPGYNITSVSATVGGSTLTVSNNGNEYTITISGATVTGNIEITVNSEEDGAQGYDVTFTAPDGYSVVCEDVHTGVEAGTVIEFTVNVPESYSDEIEVYAADTKLEPTNGKYTLEVIEDTEVVVKVYINISDTTKEETHYSISGTGRFEYPVAQPYTFTVTADEYYNIASVTVNGQVLEGVEGVYTIPSEMLINDVNIVVDANQNEYTINYYDYEYADLSKNFYVELEEPLRVSAAQSAVYTIDNIGSFSLADISEKYYDFLGWSEGALGDEYTTLTSEDVLAALASGNGSIDLYANWQWGGENAVESVKDALDASINVTQSAESSIRAGFDFGSNEWRFLKQELWKHGDHTEIFGYMYFTTNPNTDGVADSVSIDSIINSDDVTIYEVGTGNTSPVYRDSNLRLYAWSTGRSRIDNIVSEYGFVWSGATAEICQSRWVKGWIAINIDGDRIVIQQDNFVWFADVRTA